MKIVTTPEAVNACAKKFFPHLILTYGRLAILAILKDLSERPKKGARHD